MKRFVIYFAINTCKIQLSKFHISSFDRWQISYLHMLAGAGVEDLQRLLQKSLALLLGLGLLLFLTLHVIALLLFYVIFSILPVREIAISTQDVSSILSHFIFEKSILCSFFSLLNMKGNSKHTSFKQDLTHTLVTCASFY